MPHYLLMSEKLPGSHEHLSSRSSHYPRLASEQLQDIPNGFRGLLTLHFSQLRTDFYTYYTLAHNHQWLPVAFRIKSKLLNLV